MTGTIYHLFLKTRHKEAMHAAPRVMLEADKGIVGDIQHGRGRRQVLLMDTETLDAIGLLPGQVRENITLRGLPIQGLRPGQRLQLGAALAEVTMDCEPCEMIEAIRPGLRAAMEGKRGVLVRVIEGGEVAVGDEVRLL